MNTEQTKLTHLEAWVHFREKYKGLNRSEKGRLPKGFTGILATAQQDYKFQRLGPKRVADILGKVCEIMPDKFSYVIHVEVWFEIGINEKAASE